MGLEGQNLAQTISANHSDPGIIFYFLLERILFEQPTAYDRV